MPPEPTDHTLQQLVAAHDTPCGRCGFNLRGTDLGRGGVCPECGLEVSFRTLMGGETRDAVHRTVAARLILTKRVARAILVLLLILVGGLLILRFTTG